MTPIMTPRRRRYLFLLSISSRASTSHIVFAPIMFALHSHSVSPYQSRSSRACVTIARPRLPLLANPSINQKFYIIKLLFRVLPTQWVLSIAPCISCTIRIVVFVLFVPIPPTLPWIFILFRHRSSFLFFIVLWVVLVALSGNNASPFWDCCFV
jgi:hypothetical protein